MPADPAIHAALDAAETATLAALDWRPDGERDGDLWRATARAAAVQSVIAFLTRIELEYRRAGLEIAAHDLRELAAAIRAAAKEPTP